MSTLTVSAGPATFNLALYRGDSYAWTYQLWADGAKIDAIDLTGVAVSAQIRDRPAGTVVTNLATAVTLPNTIEVTLDAADSATAPAGGWDLQLTYTDGRVQTIVAGSVNFSGDITRP